jgi:diaminopimelate decarboxylase
MSFTYQNGLMHAEAVSLTDIAAQVGTPAYVYSAARMRANFTRLQQAMPNITLCFAMKANGNLAVLKLFAGLGAGADIVSGGELMRALKAGIPAQKIVFSGVGKTLAEIETALKASIHQFNVESLEELSMIAGVAQKLGIRAPISLRVNPDVAAGTHHKIATGSKGDKFGIDTELLPKARELINAAPSLELMGLAVHIGSQLFELNDFRQAFTVLAQMVRDLRSRGANISRLDLGGGMGVPYQPSQREFDCAGYAAVVREVIEPLGCALTIEPGRYLVADAGVLLSRVILVKQGAAHRFIICDAAMNDLVRPAMYDAYHHIRPVREATGPLSPAEVVGPICESSDQFAENRALPALAADDLLVLDTAGAYGAVMAGTYNARDLAPEVLVDGQRFHIIRPRLSPDAQMAWDSLPDWL